MEKILGLEDLPNPAYILTEEEVKILWNWIQFQHLPYDNLKLKKLVSELGDYAYAVNAER